MAEGKDSSKDNGTTNKKGTFVESVLSFMGAVLAVMSVRWLLVEPYVIPSGSMIPTLLVHDHIIVNKLAYGIRLPFTKIWVTEFSGPERGDIVVFKAVESERERDIDFMIKRVVAVPGDTVEFTSEGRLLINNQPVPTEVMSDPNAEPFYKVSAEDLEVRSIEDTTMLKEQLGSHTHRVLLRGNSRLPLYPIKIEPGHFFMMGDNRDNSQDSRFWGPLPRENILGKAVLVWLSCENTLPYVTFLCNPMELRWQRFFHLLK